MAPQQSVSYIPLDQAARKYGVSQKVLRQRADSGKLAFARLPNGDLLVADQGIDPSLNIRREDFEHLRGLKISISEASRKYSQPKVRIAPTTLSRWAKLGYIAILDRGWKVLLDEADTAYCTAVYKAKYEFYNGQMSGVPIFDEAGKPYQSRYPEMAAYKRNLRQRKKTQDRASTA